MRTFKKAIAVVLTLAMLAAMFAFTASAEATYSMVLEGPGFASVGDTYLVKVRLNDSANQVGGASGLLTVSGAELTNVEINPQLLDYNKTLAAGFEGQEAVDTIISKVSENEFSFASVANLDGKNPATRVWFMLTFKITANNPTFELDTDFSNRGGTALLADTDNSVLAPASPTAKIKLVPNAGVAQTTDLSKQGLKIDAAFDGGIPADALEYGMLFCPEQLLEKDANGFYLFDCETENTNIKKASSTDISAIESFNAFIKFNFTDPTKGYTLSRVKIAAKAYYVTAEGEYVYSENTVSDEAVNGGMFSKAIVTVAAEKASTATDDAVLSAVENVNNGTASDEDIDTILAYLLETFGTNK